MTGKRHPQASQHVQKKIVAGDPWYVGSQLAWAQRPEIRPIYEKRYRYLRKCVESARARLGPRLKLLDAGCGDGYWLERLSRLGNLDLCGLDYNPLRIERARALVPGAKLRVGDLMAAGAGEVYDVVLLNQVIEHVRDDAGLLGKTRSLLKPGGVLILGTTNEGSCLQQLGIRRRGPSFETDHVHFYTEKEIRGKIEAAGFVVESVMREVFYPGSDRIYYGLTRRSWGFHLLEALSVLFPSQCSDFYFECRAI